MDVNEIAKAIPVETDREEFLGLAKRYKSAAKKPTNDPDHDQALDRVVEQMEWGLRTKRYPMPTREELKTMIEDEPD